MKSKLAVVIVCMLLIGTCYGYIRVSMYELFTSGTCGPCVSVNNHLDDWYPLHHDDICLIRYHTSWPGSGDPFYAANPSQNAARTSYYSVGGVPKAVVNGTSVGSWSAADGIALSVAGTTVPLGIELMPIDSGQVRVEVLCDAPTFFGTLDLTCVLIEDSLHYSALNGQTEFYQVMRYMLPGHGGISLTINGDTSIVLDYDFRPHMGIVDDYRHCSYVAYLQDNSGAPGEIYQCNKIHVDAMTDYGHFVEHGTVSNLTEPVDTSAFEATLTHFGLLADNYDIWMEGDYPAGWLAGMTVNGAVTDSTRVLLSSLDVVEIEIDISPLGDPSTGRVCVYISPVNDPEGGVDTVQFSVIAGGNVLYVGSSVAAGDMPYFRDLFADNDVEFSEWSIGSNGHLPDYSDMEFEAMVWQDGANITDGMNATERLALRDYLENGGKVLITSSGMGADLGSLMAFYLLVLGATYQGSEYSPTGVSGSTYPGTELTDFNGTLPGAGFPGEKISVSAPAEAILRYNTGPTCGLKKDFTGGGKLIYLTFQYELIEDESERDELWDCIVDYWGGLGIEEREMPVSQSIIEAYPNPFNSCVTLSFDNIRTGALKIEVFDIAGRMIDVIHNGTLPAEHKSIQWDATAFSSGVYLIRATGEGVSAQSKVLLVK